MRLRPQALSANLEVARRRAAGAELVAMIKANGYGHGLVLAAEAFAKADRLGVALLEEAAQLRDAAIDTPLLIVEGCFDAAEYQQAAAFGGCACVIHAPWQVELLAQQQLDAPLEIWLKLDSGMHRLGMTAADLREHYRRLQQLPQARVTTLMTHLACADEAADEFSEQQAQQAQALAAELGLRCSVANSAGLLRYPQWHADAVRPGILLYGSSPLQGKTATELGLAVSFSFHSRLIAIQEVPAGDRVGYGQRWQAQQPSRIGVVAVGYGDGYPRRAPDGTPVAVKTAAGIKQTVLAGRVSMDMLTIDLSDLSEARVDDEVELWGEQVDVDEVARRCGTISYELFCQVTARPQRVVNESQ